MSKNQQGFSLIELLIVVCIIGIIASIAIPNLLASRRAANEASAISSMRTISSAEATFFATAGVNANYGDETQLYNQQLITAPLAASGGVNVGGNPVTGTPKSGYNFDITDVDATTGTPASYVSTAFPVIASGVTASGTRRFCVTEDGVVRYTGTATGGALATSTACRLFTGI